MGLGGGLGFRPQAQEVGLLELRLSSGGGHVPGGRVRWAAPQGRPSQTPVSGHHGRTPEGSEASGGTSSQGVCSHRVWSPLSDLSLNLSFY